MGDSILNFSDMGSPEYTGLYDTGTGFSGSSTLQDVQLGSPVLLDTSLNNTNFSTYDFASMTDSPSFVGPMPLNGPEAPVGTPNPAYAFASQSLAGTSDTPLGSSAQSSPTPMVAQPNAASGAALSALSKFGASIASLWTTPAKTVAGAQPVTQTPAGASLLPGGASGTNVILLVIMVGALIVLLARSE
jgi:hypothetical protein